MTTLFPLPSPSLPEGFISLIVAGSFHASAPIHLCLTHLASRPGKKAVLLSPSRENFLSSAIQFNDDWLNECGGYGAVAEVLSRVIALYVLLWLQTYLEEGTDRLTNCKRYPSSPLHLTLALSMIKPAEASDEPTAVEKIPLDEPPALIVLHELSSYFQPIDDPSTE